MQKRWDILVEHGPLGDSCPRGAPYYPESATDPKLKLSFTKAVGFTKKNYDELARSFASFQHRLEIQKAEGLKQMDVKDFSVAARSAAIKDMKGISAHWLAQQSCKWEDMSAATRWRRRALILVKTLLGISFIASFIMLFFYAEPDDAPNSPRSTVILTSEIIDATFVLVVGGWFFFTNYAVCFENAPPKMLNNTDSWIVFVAGCYLLLLGAKWVITEVTPWNLTGCDKRTQ